MATTATTLPPNPEALVPDVRYDQGVPPDGPPLTTALDSPGIVFPPPLIFFAGIGVGAAVDHFVPMPLGPAELRVPLAILTFLGGALLLYGATQMFKETKNDLRTDRPATSLLTTSVYQNSRNPMYLGFALVYASAALLAANPWTLLLLPPCVLVLQALVINAEERYLLRRFGHEYLAYCEKTRRWL